MARIRVPRSFSQLETDVKPAEWVPLMAKYRVTDSRGRYLHWNDFQWRVEKGDDTLAAWYATKVARMAISQEFPLKAEDNRFFSYCIPESLFAQLHTIDTLVGRGDGSPFVSSNEKDRYLVRNLMLEEAITSSQLEGASTTRDIAKEMLTKNLPPQDKSQQMIVNNYLLMQRVLEKKDEDLSIGLILELHGIATYKAIDNQASPGEIRKDNHIFISDLYGENSFCPPDWRTIPSRLQDLCAFANESHNQNVPSEFIHPIVKAIILHFMIGYIHPFGDGNGRTARALFYWYMLRSDYWLFEYISISKLIQEKRSAYDKAFLYTETDDFDLTYFLYNQVEAIDQAVQSLHDYINGKNQAFDQFRDWISKSPITKRLKRGQLDILQAALETPGKEFTAGQVALDFGVTVNTARSYLNNLVDKDLLIEAKSKNSKTIIYIAPANLKTRLKLP